MDRYTKENNLLIELEDYLKERHSIALSVKKIKETLERYEAIERAYKQ